MGEAFQRTLRSIAADTGRPSRLAIGIGAVLLFVWAGWMALARVPVRVLSTSARVEAARDPRRVESAVDGEVVSIAVGLGDPVEAGQVLVQIDDTRAVAARDDAVALRDGLVRQLERLTEARDALAGASALDGAARAAASDGARAATEQGRIAARQAADEAARAEALAASGAIGAQELERARNEARRLELEASVRAQVLRQLTSEQAGGARSGDVELGRIERELADLGAERTRAEAAVVAAEAVLRQHAIVAPVAGRIGALAERQAGGIVRAGDLVATVVPQGDLRIVASFAPSAALGRIAAGQPGRMRLDGFPWTSFGAIGAVVERVGAEPDPDGTIRVELAIAPGDGGVPAWVTHGLPGELEVEVERVSPAALVLRAAGRSGA